MSSRVWNIISLLSLIIIIGAGAMVYFDQKSGPSELTSKSTKQQVAVSVAKDTPDYAPKPALVAVNDTPETMGKTLTPKQEKQVKALWDGCNDLDADKRLAGCNKLIKSKLETQEALLLAYANRASAYGEKEKYSAAIKDYSLILRQDSDNFDAYISRGDILQLTNRFDKAIRDYTTALTIKKDDHVPYLSRAWAYYQMDKVNAGILDLDKAIKLQDSDSELYTARGQFYETIGRNKDAAKNYKTALKLNSTLVEAQDGLKRTDGGAVASNSKRSGKKK